MVSFTSKGYENALLMVTKTIDRMMMTSEIQLRDLVVFKIARPRIRQMQVAGPTRAAIQLANKGESKMIGEGVEYIFTNLSHMNPICRVTSREFI
jgi:hypothetical protein